MAIRSDEIVSIIKDTIDHISGLFPEVLLCKDVHVHLTKGGYKVWLCCLFDPALSVNKVCLSGIDAIALADQLIRAGEFEIIVAGGQESMTNAPHLLEKSGLRHHRLSGLASLSACSSLCPGKSEAMGCVLCEISSACIQNLS